jgi:membrane-associated phospholipid phosphatase
MSGGTLYPCAMASSDARIAATSTGSATADHAAARHSERPPSRLSAAFALRGAALCMLGLALTWVLAELVPVVHWRDAVALNDFTELGRPRVDRLANGLLDLLNPLLYTLWALLLVAVALVRRRPRVALAVAVVLPAAPLSAELLKPLLAHAHDHVGYQWIGAASWPSGHATAAMTLVLCALLVAPHRLRPTIAVLGGAFAIAVGFSLLILAWHMPSDVLGGYLLAALYGSLALAALRFAERRDLAAGPAGAEAVAVAAARRPEARWRSEDLLAPAGILLAGVLATVIAVLIRAGQVETFADDHHLVLVSAASIAVLVALICSSLTLALRR